jgi:hypothetical protein
VLNVLTGGATNETPYAHEGLENETKHRTAQHETPQPTESIMAPSEPRCRHAALPL